MNGTTHIAGIEEPRVLSAGEAERAASRAEAVAVDLGRHASALFGWAFENRFTDPDPATPGAVAYALETHARALRQLDAGWMGESVHSLTNRERGERAGVAFLASRYAAEEGEPLTNVADLLHLADRLAQPEGGPLGDAALKRRHDAESGRDLTLGEFTASRARGRYGHSLGCSVRLSGRDVTLDVPLCRRRIWPATRVAKHPRSGRDCPPRSRT